MNDFKKNILILNFQQMQPPKHVNHLIRAFNLIK